MSSFFNKNIIHDEIHRLPLKFTVFRKIFILRLYFVAVWINDVLSSQFLIKIDRKINEGILLPHL